MAVAAPKEIKGYKLEPFAQCAGAMLAHARLNAANLYSMDLRGASLREAQLAGAHVAEARLAGADLTGAVCLVLGHEDRGGPSSGSTLG